ncbi:hypothetical protein [Actinomadura miaoliensis]|uniref:hypothetical protein n=1 Tax=Actinomadura miaoliensis TaxID=430685 RepID=UPI0031F1965D
MAPTLFAPLALVPEALSAPARMLLAAWLDERSRQDGPLRTGQRGPPTTSGLAQVQAAGRRRRPRCCGVATPR